MSILIPTELQHETDRASDLSADRIRVFAAPPDATKDTFREDVRRGLSGRRKCIPSKHLYDDAGARLFERICTLPEYYPTRTEEKILATCADEIAEAVRGAGAMTELGAGSAAKTGRLLEKLIDSKSVFTYNPIDISEEMIRLCAQRLLREHDRLRIVAMICEYESGLQALEQLVPEDKVYVFLGSSVGNLTHGESARFLGSVRESMNDADSMLIGIDMAKDTDVLLSAYDDAAGVTAAFNKNLLKRINRTLDGDFDLDAFRHEARYEEDKGRIEMHLVSEKKQVVNIGELDLSVPFGTGESIHTENSHKYTPEAFDSICSRAGLAVDRFWNDPQDWFRVVQLRRAVA